MLYIFIEFYKTYKVNQTVISPIVLLSEETVEV